MQWDTIPEAPNETTNPGAQTCGHVGCNYQTISQLWSDLSAQAARLQRQEIYLEVSDKEVKSLKGTVEKQYREIIDLNREVAILKERLRVIDEARSP